MSGRYGWSIWLAGLVVGWQGKDEYGAFLVGWVGWSVGRERGVV